jgi:beta-glucosidase
MPEGRGAVNGEGLDFYERLVDGMLERGLKPAATLYHWELPSPLADLGGWRNRDIANWFADYTEVLMRRIGDRVWSAAPINEPWCVAWLSHFRGQHAPGLRDIRATARAMHHVGLAHGRSIQAMRGLGMKNLGAVCNFEYAQPADDSAEAAAAARLYDGYYNRWFLSAMFRKDYPADVLEGLGPHMPEGWQDDMDTISSPVDWAGLNYYSRKLIGPTGGPWPAHGEVTGQGPKTDMGWEIYPEGLAYFLRRTAQDYTGDLPLYVTENGMAAPDQIKDGAVQDDDRIAFLAQHLQAVQAVIAEGVPVKGYFTWSLLDNYEWALGYDKRFGLIHVDFESLQRTPKASYHALGRALAR